MVGSRPRWAAATVLAALLGGPAAVVAKDLGGGWQQKKNGEGQVVQELKLEAPSFTEEDQYGYVMPDRYRCDSCRAVMFHLDQDLRKKQPKSRRMKQWEYTDVLDETCRGAFQGYGVKLINGENALSGPGLKMSEELAPGSGAIQMGGESWSKRLGEICRKIVYEKVGEEEIYDKFYKGFHAQGGGAAETPDDAAAGASGLTESLCFAELRDCVAGPKPPPPKKDAEEAKPEKAKAKKASAKAKAETKASAAARPKADSSSKTAAATAAAASAPPASAAPSEERIDVQTFLRGLATRHGLSPDEYLTTRTASEWERLTVAMAGRIFNKLSSQPEEACRAGWAKS